MQPHITCRRLGILFTLIFLSMPGCSKPNLKMEKPYPAIIKEYKHVHLIGTTSKATGLYLQEGDLYSILVTGSIDLWPGGPADFPYHDIRPEYGSFFIRFGDRQIFYPLSGLSNATTRIVHTPGQLFLGYKAASIDAYGKPKKPGNLHDDSGGFSVDIIVWQREDWVQIADFFQKMLKQNPDNNAVQDAYNEARKIADIFIATQEKLKEISAAEREIEEIKNKIGKSSLILPEQSEIDTKTLTGLTPDRPSMLSTSEGDQIAYLETKLAMLNETLAQLDEMKRKYEEQKKKYDLLTRELAERDKREKLLLTQLKESTKFPPVIVIASPADNSTSEIDSAYLSGVVQDESGLAKLELFLNGRPFKGKEARGLVVVKDTDPKQLEFKHRIPLEKGSNQLKIRAIDSGGLIAEKTLTIHFIDKGKKLLAVIIGIDSYPNIKPLKYAVNDANLIYEHLLKYNQLAAENATLLLNGDATLQKIRKALGTTLKKRAGKDDMVIIFFAGHGATEEDTHSPDGDGLEKYLLPYDADLNDLYSTALPMAELSRIFKRIGSERLIYIADACYSGASGGRTIETTGIRANISAAFLDRIAAGKGRVIMTASNANEVSSENDDLKHGVFTYYLVEGMRGKADIDGDGIVTVDEAYNYVSTTVPRATGQAQHPVKKGAVEGLLIMSVVK